MKSSFQFTSMIFIGALLMGFMSSCVDMRDKDKVTQEETPVRIFRNAEQIKLCTVEISATDSSCAVVTCPSPTTRYSLCFGGGDIEGVCELTPHDENPLCRNLVCGTHTMPVCNGADGVSCVTGPGDEPGTFTMTCTNGSVTWRDGEPGPQGPPGPPGQDGQNGQDGYNSLIRLSVADEVSCPYGGTKLEVGLDNGDAGGTARNGILEMGEVDSFSYVCNGTPGQPGTSWMCNVGEDQGYPCRTYTCGPVVGAGGTLLYNQVMYDVCDGEDGQNGTDGVGWSCWFGTKVGLCTPFSCGPITGSREQIITTQVCDGQDGYSNLFHVHWFTNASDTPYCPSGGGWVIAQGLDNGDGDGIARNGILEMGEVDNGPHTVCMPANGVGCTYETVMVGDLACYSIQCGGENTEPTLPICPGQNGTNGQGCDLVPDEDGSDCVALCCGEHCVPICPHTGGGCTSHDECDDSNVCNGTEMCVDGICRAGTPLQCNDNNPCTDDTCDPSTGCVNTPDDNNACSDSNLCNGTEMCVSGHCVPGTPLTCNDGNVCNGTEVCDPATGCVSGSPLTCNDSNMCTTDSCDSTTGCLYTPVSVDDQNVCTTDSCNAATGAISHTPIVCNDNNACTTDSCNPVTGCAYAPIVCDDNDETTTDTCNPATGCVYTSGPAMVMVKVVLANSVAGNVHLIYGGTSRIRLLNSVNEYTHTFELLKSEACEWGVDTAIQVPNASNWWDCNLGGTFPTKFGGNVLTWVNGVSTTGTAQTRTQACGNAPPGNLWLSPAQLGCAPPPAP